MQYQITASIVLYNNDESVKKAINSFLSTHLQLKLYLVDNSPSDKLRNELSDFIEREDVEYIFNNKNVGYGAGHNVAIKQIINISKYHLVLNPDIEFGEGVIEELLNFMGLNADVGHVIPKVLFPDGDLQYVCKLIPTPFNFFSRFLPIPFLTKYNQKFELRFSGYNKIMNIPYLSGCFMFLRCDALKEVGLFDERFFMYPEDIDLTRRIHKKYRTVFYPYVHVSHEHAKASYKNFKLFLVHINNTIKYFNKWGWFFDEERKAVNKKTIEQINNL